MLTLLDAAFQVIEAAKSDDMRLAAASRKLVREIGAEVFYLSCLPPDVLDLPADGGSEWKSQA